MQTINQDTKFFPKSLYDLVNNSIVSIRSNRKAKTREILFNAYCFLNQAKEIEQIGIKKVSDIHFNFPTKLQAIVAGSAIHVLEYNKNIFATRKTNRTEKTYYVANELKNGKVRHLMCPANYYTFPILTNEDFAQENLLSFSDMGIDISIWNRAMEKVAVYKEKQQIKYERIKITNKANASEKRAQKELFKWLPTIEQMAQYLEPELLKQYENHYEALVNRKAEKSRSQDRTQTGFCNLNGITRDKLLELNGFEPTQLDLEKSFTNILLSLFTGTFNIEYFQKCLDEITFEDCKTAALKWNLSKYKHNPNQVKKSELIKLTQEVFHLMGTTKAEKKNWNQWLNFSNDLIPAEHIKIEKHLKEKAGKAGEHFVRMIHNIKRGTKESNGNSLMYYLCAHVESIMIDTIQYKAAQQNISALRIHDALMCDQKNLEALKALWEQELTSFGMQQKFNRVSLINNTFASPKMEYVPSIPEETMRAILFSKLAPTPKIEIDLTPMPIIEPTYNSYEEWSKNRWDSF